MKVHVLDIRVRYGETDCAGVVYYANYLHYFEAGRTEYLRALGTAYRTLEEQGIFLVVAEARCKYLGRAGYDDQLELYTWVDRLRPTRIDFRSAVALKGAQRPIAVGHVVLACLEASGRPRRVPEELVRRIELCDGPPWARGL